MLQVNQKRLWAIYGIVPFALLLVIIDQFNHQYLANTLPDDPDDWIIWAALFGMPHVYASYFSLADSEYYHHFKEKLMLPFFLSFTLPIVIAHLIGIIYLFLFFSLFTIYHFTAQQHGIALSYGKMKPTLLYKINTYLVSLTGGILFFFIYESQRTLSLQNYAHMMEVFAWIMVMLSLMITLLTHTKMHLDGKRFLWLNWITFFTAIMVYSVGLEILAIIMGRFIHDLTAVYVYGTHDHNRNLTQTKNEVFKRLPWISHRYGAVILAVLTGLVITLLDKNYHNFLLTFMVCVAVFHYYFESMVWKRESPARRYLSFN